VEGVSPDVDLDEVARAMMAVTSVKSVHDLHVWSLGSSEYALSAHVQITDIRCWPAILETLKDSLDFAARDRCP
jgi:cobalt-zinc-cadmium efflux system protein